MMAVTDKSVVADLHGDAIVWDLRPVTAPLPSTVEDMVVETTIDAMSYRTALQVAIRLIAERTRERDVARASVSHLRKALSRRPESA
jgi:hypothetical protein